MKAGCFDFGNEKALLSPDLLQHFYLFKSSVSFVMFIFLNLCFYRTELIDQVVVQASFFQKNPKSNLLNLK